MRKNHLICTIIAPNYLPQALVLGTSLAQNMPDASFRILMLKDEKDNSLIDEVLKGDEYLQGSLADHSTLSIQEVNWEDFDLLGAVNKYDLLEFATSVKPALIRYLLKDGWDRVTYLDPDIQVFKDFSKLLSETQPISLTPHILQDFPTDGKLPDHQTILYAGTYNLGFISCKQESISFLNWWSRKLENFCTMEIFKGYHVDQKWVDWAPSFCETQILRNPGLNVAYWNLHERSVTLNEGKYCVAVEEILEPLYFFHFSGFDDFKDFHISKHTTRNFSSKEVAKSFIMEYASHRTQWNDRLIKSNWKMELFTSKWSLGGREVGAANSPEFRSTLVEVGQRRVQPLNTVISSTGGELKLKLSSESIEGPAVGWLISHIFSRKQAKHLSSAERQLLFDSGYSDKQIELGLIFAESMFANAPRIKIVGYFASPTGLGQIARNTASLLERYKIPFTAECIATEFDSLELTNAFRRKYLVPSDKEDLTLSFINADSWLTDGIYSSKVDRNKQFVTAVWAWEVESIPPEYIQISREIDRLFALSKFSADALSNAIGRPVGTFPTYCQELNFPRKASVPRNLLTKAIPELPNRYVLCRFDAKSVIKRKNPQAVLKVWETIHAEFPEYKLVLKTTDLRKIGSAKLFKQLIEAQNVTLIDYELDQETNDSLMIHASAYISLHRAEGLGLNILEAIFADVPAVFTNYSGLSKELNNIGFKVDYSLVKIGGDAHPYPTDGLWAEPQIDHAIKQLRTALGQVENGDWRQGREKRGEWVELFLSQNSELAISEVRSLLESISSVEHRFNHHSIQETFFLRHVLRKFYARPLLRLWIKLPIKMRQKLKTIIIKLHFGFLSRDINF